MLLARESHQYAHHYEKRAGKSRKTRKVRRFRASTRVLYTAVLLFAFLTFLLLTTRYAQITATGYEIVEMKKQLRAVEADNQELELKLTKLQSLERIEVAAVGKLGMVNPDSSEGVQFIAVESEVTPKTIAKTDQTTDDGSKAAVQSVATKPIAVIEALTRLLGSWTGKAVRAEAGVVSE